MNLKGFFFKHCSIFKIPAVWNSFNILPHSLKFVKYFFQVFSNFFERLFLSKQLLYYITFLRTCQAFFQKSFSLFLFRSLSFDSFIIISLSSSFVKYFFQIPKTFPKVGNLSSYFATL